jgi:branched-chain amino acid transport system ATP-binding protein
VLSAGAGMVEPMLSLEGLTKSFGALRVSDDVTLDIRRGELHALIGPNGAGKTSLIHQASGSLAPDAGRVVFDGEDVTGLPMYRRAGRGLARTFQITTLLARFSVLENAAIAAQSRSGSSFRLFGKAAEEEGLNEEAMQALAVVGLEERAHVQAGALSHGEKRGLELAIALALRPKLLLLDEPMAGAGIQESAVLINTLQRLKGHYTILLVEHDMQAVFALADRISVMVNGRIIATGDPAAVRADARVREAYLGEAA